MKKVLGRGLEALIPTGAASATGAAGVMGTMDASYNKADVTDLSNPNVIREIPIARIKPSPFQPRLKFDEAGLNELAQSIETRGVIQPVVVRAAGDSYELIVGERRLRAVERLGRPTIPAVVFDGISNEEAMELTLIENIQREDLNPIEEARAYYRLMTECNLTQEVVAAKVGKNRATVGNAVRLLSLPEEILQMIYAGSLSAGHARALLAVAGDAEKIALAQKVIAGIMSVRDLERAVYSEKSEEGGRRVSLGKGKIRPVEVVALEDKLKRVLGTKVQLTLRRKGGRIMIEYYSNDELDRLLGMFGVKD
jgi:ParB family chromosome partitioning protein